jgi:ABC-2 type transport system ATP-binding protein
MPEILMVKDLTKIFNRRIVAVDNLTLHVRRGEIFAFLGPNGAGKSTSLKMFCGLAKPSSGQVTLSGISLKENREKYLSGLGLVSQHFNVDTDLSAKENMLVHGFLHRQRGEMLKERVSSLLAFAGLSEYEDVPTGNFSGGMKRKLQIVRAILHKPEMIFLDEPTVGLDAHSRERIWGLLKGLNSEDKTIFFSTHYIEEAENYADRVGIIHKGKLIRVDTPKALIEEIGPWCRETFANGLIKRSHFLTREKAEREGNGEGEKEGKGYQKLVVRRTQLEDVFIHLTGEEALL